MRFVQPCCCHLTLFLSKKQPLTNCAGHPQANHLSSSLALGVGARLQQRHSTPPPSLSRHLHPIHCSRTRSTHVFTHHWPASPAAAWLLTSIEAIWSGFRSRFQALWAAHGSAGDLFPAALTAPYAPHGPATLAACQEAFMDTLFHETLKFMGGCTWVC